MDAKELNQPDAQRSVAGVARNSGRHWQALLLLASLALGSASEVGAQQSTPPAATGPLKVGVFSGGFDPRAAAQYELWLGRKSDFNVEFLTETAFSDSTAADGKKNSDALTHAGWLLGVWRGPASRSERNMLFSIPLATKQDNSLAHVASGQYDTVYQQIAKDYASAYPTAIIRIGWEFNADWYSWKAKDRTADYIAAFRHVAAIFKTASPRFTIDWCPVNGFSANFPAEQAYPGDDIVDVIGMDVYNDYRWGDHKDDAHARWDWEKNFQHGLVWQQQFAEQHHKRMSLPEWGVNRDDPYFIEQMYDWITHHDFAYVAYWNSNSAFSGMLSNNQYPNAAAEYRRLFGALP